VKSYTFGRAIFLGLVAAVAALLVVAPGNAAQPLAGRIGLGSLVSEILSAGTYRQWMLALIVGVPGILFLAMSVAPRLSPRFIWIPNARYWLAPERRSRTIAYLEQQAVVFGIVVILFLCGVHWLMTGADAALSRERATISLVVLVVFLLAAFWIWLMSIQSRFRRLGEVQVSRVGRSLR